MSERFDEIRAEITANDGEIVAGVNRRLQLVAALWELKQELGIERTDPDRERQLLETLSAANTGPLSDEGLEEIVAELLALTRREIERGRATS